MGSGSQLEALSRHRLDLLTSVYFQFRASETSPQLLPLYLHLCCTKPACLLHEAIMIIKTMFDHVCSVFSTMCLAQFTVEPTCWLVENLQFSKCQHHTYTHIQCHIYISLCLIVWNPQFSSLTLWLCNIAMENGPIYLCIITYLNIPNKKMVIFQSYMKQPEGKTKRNNSPQPQGTVTSDYVAFWVVWCAPGSVRTDQTLVTENVCNNHGYRMGM